MVAIDKVLLSEDVFDNKFHCDLQACKGACCVLGDAGAPLEEEEIGIIEKVYNDVLPFMRAEGRQAVDELGKVVKDEDGDWVTPLVDQKECAYVVFDSSGIAKCAFEMAHAEGKTDFIKPISCHLYPIRRKKLPSGDALNYEQWEICDPACTLGKKMGMRVFEFVKPALIRLYGKAWYQELSNEAIKRKADGN